MTKRQREIVRAVVLGHSVNELALRLGLSRNSVHRHLSHAYAETGTRSQAELAGWCIVHGVVSMEDLRQVYGQKWFAPMGAR